MFTLIVTAYGQVTVCTVSPAAVPQNLESIELLLSPIFKAPGKEKIGPNWNVYFLQWKRLMQHSTAFMEGCGKAEQCAVVTLSDTSRSTHSPQHWRGTET